MNQTKLPHPQHPYYPLEVEIIGYLANDCSVPNLLAFFTAACIAVLGTTHFIARQVRPLINTSELLTIMWFVTSGCIHFFFEGYFAYNYKNMGELQTLFGQLWKEYALADSRYLTQDPFVLSMEAITAVFWGPLCFVMAYMILRDHPMRHPLQILVSLGQMYGDILYYATSMFDHFAYDISYSRPELVYFWGYYFSMNFIWIVIPGFLIYESVVASTKAHRAIAVAAKSLENLGITNGIAKKIR